MRVIDVLRTRFPHIDCLPNERFTLNVAMFSEDVDQQPFPKQILFESPPLKSGRQLVPEYPYSQFKFFLDGSQRSYRVIEASIQGSYLPICAGQIGVAVLERTSEGRLIPRRDLIQTENIIAVPSKLNEDDTQSLQEAINSALGGPSAFRLVRYDHTKANDQDPGDLGRALIIHEMQMLELHTIREMIKRNLISSDKMLAKDGGLQYRASKVKSLDLNKDDRVQLRNVIGISKTFSPSLSVGTGRKRQALGNLTKGLEWKERSTVISPDQNSSAPIAWWYIRLRPREKVYSPLQGIVKVEIFSDDTDKQHGGVSSARADAISSYVLRERNVTPYKLDARWATHLYGIFLAETYLKSSFASHERFKSLII